MLKFKITDVRCHKGDSAFLLDNGKTAILYDTGFGFTGFAVAENVRRVLGERKLDYIFLSHSHYDHALGSAYVLRSYPDAKVVAGRYAAEIFQRDGAKRVMKELDTKFAAICGVTDYEFLGDELRVDIPCEDGDQIIIDNAAFTVMNFPGHTKCSVGYYCKEEKLLLAPETLGVYDGEGMVMPSYLVGYGMTIQSIERAEKLDVKQILSPHYGLLDEEQTAFFLANMKEAAQKMAEEILQQIRDGASNAEMIENFKKKYWHGYIREIYPIDAANLNTMIMIDLIRRELADQENT